MKRDYIYIIPILNSPANHPYFLETILILRGIINKSVTQSHDSIFGRNF